MRKYTIVLGLMFIAAALIIAVGACQPQTPVVIGAQAVRERASIYARTDSYIVNGADILWYSDDRSTGTASIAGDTGLGTFTDLTVSDDMTVTDDLDVDGAVTLNSTLDVDGAISSGTGAISTTGKIYHLGSADSDANNYDYMAYIDYAMTGVTTKDRNYGLFIEGTRAAGQEVQSGDFDEAGLKIRVDTHAVTTTTGTVLRGADIEAKADNPNGTSYNIYGASVTAKSDTSAGTVGGDMIALTANAQNNAEVTTNLMSADFRLMRQAATAPTNEYVVRVRNSSTSGTGADAGIYVSSDYSSSATTDSMDYGLDFSSAAINTAEVRGENGETLANTTDTAWVIGGFIAAEEATVIDLGSGGTITPTATYQPITNSTEGSITGSDSTAIADGPVAGAILILVNEDAQDIVIKDGANTAIGGDVTLTGGADDSLTLIWDGADWVGLAMNNN